MSHFRLAVRKVEGFDRLVADKGRLDASDAFSTRYRMTHPGKIEAVRH